MMHPVQNQAPCVENQAAGRMSGMDNETALRSRTRTVKAGSETVFRLINIEATDPQSYKGTERYPVQLRVIVVNEGYLPIDVTLPADFSSVPQSAAAIVCISRTQNDQAAPPAETS